MASSEKNLSTISKLPDGSAYKIGIVVSTYYYDEITSKLLHGCKEILLQQNVTPNNIIVEYAPGTFELPLACSLLNQSNSIDAVIALGCVIKGETDHDKYINQSVADSLQQLSIKENKPFVFGVLTPNNVQQALDRAGGKHGNKGVEVASAALQMIALKKRLNQSSTSLGFK